MFRPIRRIKKEIDQETAKAVLKNARIGVFAVNGDDGYPYAIPVNYLYDEEAGKIYFHGARAGHKYDALQVNDKVCFTVYGEERIKDLEWAPYVQSVVIFGRCRLLENDESAMDKLRRMSIKYFPSMELVEEEIGRSGKGVQMYEIEIEHMSGKEIQEK